MKRVRLGFPFGGKSRNARPSSNPGNDKDAQMLKTLCPFNCKLDCAAFTCDGLRIATPTGKARNRMRVSFSVAGAKGCTKRRITRLCMHSLIDDMIACSSHLHNFRHILLRPGRAGHVRFALGPTSLRLLSQGVR